MNPEPLGESVTGPAAEPPGMAVALDADGGCIAEARRLAASFLAGARTEQGLAVTERVIGLAQLVVSELVTNAYKYAPGPVLMKLRLVEGVVEIEVWDSGPALPAPRAADPERVGQHGLEIVKAVAEKLVVRQEAVGKAVTAVIPLHGNGISGDSARP
ncbi:ATP-binding protein [Streptomyces sp. NPDC048362]|uniref:ATP-binding protein n=1 Tax=Streptomyces sp. NPDC048362 TaxID=3365539 RepID=UPI003721C233